MRTVRELIERNALCFPNREALVFGERRISHIMYAQRALRLASGLYRLGLRRQDRIAVLAMNGVEIYETYAAAEAGGYIAVPINFRPAPPEIVQVLRDCGAKILIFESTYAPRGVVTMEVVVDAYGVRHPAGMAERAVFVIDKNGIIRWIHVHRPISEAPNNEEILTVLSTL